jgi:hypothetical protein
MKIVEMHCDKLAYGHALIKAVSVAAIMVTGTTTKTRKKIDDEGQ